MKNNNGFSLIELLVAIAIFAVVAFGMVPAIIQTFSLARLGDNQTDATLYTEEAIEAVRSIKNLSWSSLVAGTYGLATNSGTWAFSGSNNVKGIYTRQVTVSDVYTDINGNPQTSGCTNQKNGNTKRVIATTTWNSSPTRSNNVTLEAYYTYWKKTAFGNWAIPLIDTTFDLPTNADLSKSHVQGNYMYMVRNSSSPNFYIYDISGVAPVQTATLTLTGNPTNIFVNGRYAYVSNSDNSSELQIVDVCNPAAPTQVGSFNATGNADGLDVAVNSNNYAFLVRFSSPDAEFIVVNVSTPATPTLTGSLDLGADGNQISLLGNYAYVTSGDNTQELKVVNITTLGTPTLTGSLNLTGNNDGISIQTFGTTAVLGRIGGELDTIDIATPATPSLLGTYSAGNNINDISLGNGNLYIFLGTSNNASEFQVVNISNLAAPALLGSFNTAGDINGVSYSPFNDRVYASTVINNQELLVFKPS